jgi:hypothetical protein
MRHREHIPKLLVKAAEVEEASQADDLLDQLKAVATNLERLSQKAEEDEDYRTAIGGQATLLKYYELLAKVRQLISDGTQINLSVHPEYLQVQTLILTTLEPYPEAREALARAIRERLDDARMTPNGPEGVA